MGVHVFGCVYVCRWAGGRYCKAGGLESGLRGDRFFVDIVRVHSSSTDSILVLCMYIVASRLALLSLSFADFTATLHTSRVCMYANHTSRSLLELQRGGQRLYRRRCRPAAQPVQKDEAAFLFAGVFGDRGVRVPVHQ